MVKAANSKKKQQEKHVQSHMESPPAKKHDTPTRRLTHIATAEPLEAMNVLMELVG
jgi:hypothetical protein